MEISKKSDCILLLCIMALHIWQICYDHIFIINSYRNIISCIVSFILITMGGIIMSHKNKLSSLIRNLAKISFCIYLVHHRIAYFLVPKLANSMKPLEAVFIVFCILGLTICFAFLVYVIQLRCITIVEYRMAENKGWLFINAIMLFINGEYCVGNDARECVMGEDYWETWR